MAGKICVYIRDTQQPADLYDSTSHWYAISVHEIGSNRPLCWKGMNYDWVWLPFKGEFNKVAGEFEVPAGTYLIKGFAYCGNVVTHMAWVQVNDGETISVNLVPTTVRFCVLTAKVGILLGTVKLEGKDIQLAKVAPAELEAFERAADALVAKLPKEIGLPFMEIDELRKRLSETPKG